MKKPRLTAGVERRWIQVPAEALPAPGGFAAVTVDGRELLIHNVEGVYHATGAVCPHQGRGLATGRLKGREFTCPWHAWVFDVTSGLSPYTPRAAVPCFPMKMDAGAVWVSV